MKEEDDQPNQIRSKNGSRRSSISSISSSTFKVLPPISNEQALNDTDIKDDSVKGKEIEDNEENGDNENDSIT